MANSMEEKNDNIEKTIRELKFRKKMIGGVDEEDVWLKLGSLMRSERDANEDASLTRKEIEGGIKTKRRNLRSRALIIGAFEKLAVLAVVLIVLFAVIFGITPMKGDDMEPRLSAGDILLYYRLEKEPKRGDILVIEREDAQYVGRIVGLPDDMVIIMDDGSINVNGSNIYESNIYFETKPVEDAVKYPIKLKDNEYFILGDKRNTAKDSRVFGPVTKDEVKGKVLNSFRRMSH